MTDRSRQPNKRRRRAGCLLAPALLLLLLGVLGAACWALTRPVRLAQPALLNVPPRMTLSRVADQLQTRGLIPSALAVKLYLRISGKSHKLKAGEYEITNGQRPLDIVDMLLKGRSRTFWLVVPEGKWASEIADLVAAQSPRAGAEFLQLVAGPRRWRGKTSFPLNDATLEGYLFPDSYQFGKSASGAQIVAAMLKTFTGKIWSAYQANPPRDGRSLHDVLVLASLVEGEAKHDDERAKIAGVYLNRLRKGQRLECDATILYACQQRLSRVVRPASYDSPFNTYRYAGLPPAPINNPGMASFMAALRPERHPYYYYVAKGDGSHIFSRTYDEHLAAIRQVRGK